MGARLVQVEGGYEIASCWLGSGDVTIGRDPSADLRIDDRFDRVSRRHVEIRCGGGQHFLSDLNSQNGTWLNGTQIHGGTDLRSGDEIQLAQQVLLVYEASADERRARWPLPLLLILTLAGLYGVAWYAIGAAPHDIARERIAGLLTSVASKEDDSRAIPAETSDKAKKAVEAYESGKPDVALKLLQRAVSELYHAGHLDDVQRRDRMTVGLTRLGAVIDTDLAKIYELAQEDRPKLLPKVENKRCRLDTTPSSGFDSCLRDWVAHVIAELGQDPTQTPDEFYDEVAATLRRERGAIMSAMKRGKPYVPTIRHELRRQNMPELLHYLASIESAYHEDIGSSAGAVGMWQFIKGTAVRYDLKVTAGTDERKDWEKSTVAAAAYLNDLAFDFGVDALFLALAGYNRGEDGVRRALRNLSNPYTDRSYWRLKELQMLPQETRDYVPRFVAHAVAGEGGLPKLPVEENAVY